MHFFSYGLVADQYKSNAILTRGIIVVSKEVWVKGELYDTGLGFPAMTAGENKVEGILFEIDELALKTVFGLAKNFDKLNPSYVFELTPLMVYTAKISYEGHAFMYRDAQGLTKIT
jgi:gamma-glutamylcyclotransferase (GGCT)/AIG2-like uncharacterized protein YtfP